MPIDENIRVCLDDYCKKDLSGDIDWHINQFRFIDDIELQNRIGRAYYSTRYIYKLMEALHVCGNELHPFIKFQVIQYASIFEAVITYLLWDKLSNHPEVIQLQIHKAYKPVSALGSLCKMTYDSQELYTCVYKDTKTPKNSIPFKDKVDCAIRIGFIDEAYSEDIKKIYELRNLAHIETEADKKEEVSIEDAKNGYWRLKPFIDKINEYFSI